MRRLWAPEEDATMLDLLDRGKPVEEVAIALGRSLEATKKRRAVLNRRRSTIGSNAAEGLSDSLESESEDSEEFRCDDVMECVSTVGRSLPLEDSHLWLRLKRKLEIRAGDASTWRLAIIVEVNQSLQQVSLGSCLPSGRRDPHGGPGGGGMSALLHL